MILEWSHIQPAIRLEWAGPKNITTSVASMQELERIVAVIAGPPGRPGEDGITTIIHQFDGDLPEVLDLGNF